MRFCKILATYLLPLIPYLLLTGASSITLPDIETALIAQKYDDARRMSQTLMAQTRNPAEKSQAQYYFAVSCLHLAQYASAREAFAAVMSAHPANNLYEKAALGEIDGYYLDGIYDAALKKAQSFRKKNFRSDVLSLVYLKIARANLKLANWPQAKEYLEKIIKEFPDSLEVRAARDLLSEKQYFTVQVGAFKERPMAETLVRELSSKGDYTYIVETNTADGKKIYRVRVGQMSALGDARKLQTKLSQLGYSTLIYP